MLQHLADGRVDLVLGRGNTAPVYPSFGKNIQDGVELAIENYSLLRRLWDEDTVNWSGKFRTRCRTSRPPRARSTASPPLLARLHPHAADRRGGRVLR